MPDGVADSPSVHFWKRAGWMCIGWGSVGLVYFGSWSVQGQPAILHETMLDQWIAFDPRGIWLYLSFFVLIPYTYMQTDFCHVPWLAKAMTLCALLSGCIFLACPTTLHYPVVGDVSVSEHLLHLLLSADTSQNCFPSLHAALTLLCVWALLDYRKPVRSILAVVVAVGICYSIIALRRHISIDVSGGLMVGWLCGWICSMPLVLPCFRKSQELS